MLDAWWLVVGATTAGGASQLRFFATACPTAHLPSLRLSSGYELCSHTSEPVPGVARYDGLLVSRALLAPLGPQNCARPL